MKKLIYVKFFKDYPSLLKLTLSMIRVIFLEDFGSMKVQAIFSIFCILPDLHVDYLFSKVWGKRSNQVSVGLEPDLRKLT